MTQLVLDKAAQVLRARLAKFQIRLDESDAMSLMTLLRSQGWKLTSRDPDPDMLDATATVKFAEGSDFNSAEQIWCKMWDRA